jgi:hypothetical protein
MAMPLSSVSNKTRDEERFSIFAFCLLPFAFCLHCFCPGQVNRTSLPLLNRRLII